MSRGEDPALLLFPPQRNYRRVLRFQAIGSIGKDKHARDEADTGQGKQPRILLRIRVRSQRQVLKCRAFYVSNGAVEVELQTSK